MYRSEKKNYSYLFDLYRRSPQERFGITATLVHNEVMAYLGRSLLKNTIHPIPSYRLIWSWQSGIGITKTQMRYVFCFLLMLIKLCKASVLAVFSFGLYIHYIWHWKTQVLFTKSSKNSSTYTFHHEWFNYLRELQLTSTSFLISHQ